MQSGRKNKNDMKKIITKVLACCFLLAVLYFVCADGVMTVFDVPRSYQYIFNFSAILLLIPLGLHFLLGMEDSK